MGTSSFEHIVRLQFNALMMIVIKGALSSHRRQMNILAILYRFKLCIL